VSVGETVVKAPSTGNALVAALQACTFGAIAGTFTLAFFLSRAKGSVQGRRSVTLGSKIALVLGGTVCLNLAACWIGVEAIQNATTISSGGLMAAQVCLALYPVLFAVFSVGVGLWLSRDMLRRTDRVTQAMRAMSRGDLTQPPINSSDRDEIGELARAADGLKAYLNDFVTDLSISSRELAGTAGQVAVAVKSDVPSTSHRSTTGSNGTNGHLSTSGSTSRSATEQVQDVDRFFRAVASAIQTVATASRESGAGLSQCAGAASELASKADELLATVGRFRVQNGPPVGQSPLPNVPEHAHR